MNENAVAISVSELALRLGVSKPTAYRLARSEGFPAFTCGGRVLVSLVGLEQWVNKQIEQNEQKEAGI